MIEQLKAGAILVYDIRKQAWFPDAGEPLEGDLVARGELQADANYEPHIGLRTRDAEIKQL